MMYSKIGAEVSKQIDVRPVQLSLGSDSKSNHWSNTK